METFIPIDPNAKMTPARIKKYEDEKIRLDGISKKIFKHVLGWKHMIWHDLKNLPS